MTAIKSNKTGIKAELEMLGKNEWSGVVETLIDRFKGYTFDQDKQSPEAEILAILESLQSGVDESLIDTIFVSRISRADMFSHRAFRDTPSGATYWNPLAERYSDFSRAGNTTKYQSESEYPAPDIIGNWCHYQIRTTSQ